jgi:hypothetical protein
MIPILVDCSVLGCFDVFVSSWHVLIVATYSVMLQYLVLLSTYLPVICRSDWIRTSDNSAPDRGLFQTELHSVRVIGGVRTHV